MRYILILLSFVFTHGLSAQDTVALNFNDYFNQVIKYHPVAAQANTLTPMAKAELRMARGGFDPVIDMDYNNKTGNGKESYTYFTPTLKIPTLPGVELKAGMEQSSGTNIDPERAKYDAQNNTFNGYSLLYGGVSVPIGRGLFIDSRRVALRQAQLLQNLNEAERIKQINKLLFEAAKEYWNWYLAYERYKLMQTNMVVASNRLSFIKNRIKLGEEKPIDSVEASIEYKRREVLFVEAMVDFLNAGYMLGNFLWSENNVPVQLKSNVIPAQNGSESIVISSDSLRTLISFADQNHPEIVKLNVKLKQLEFDRRLAAENIKPQVNLNYYPYRSFNSAGEPDGVNNIFANNYKFGVQFYSSLFLRKERGKLALSKFKIKQTEFELIQNKREITNGIYTAYNELDNLAQLIKIQEYLTQSAEVLRNAEEIRFDNGESSLFLVNARERSLIEAQVKLVELRAKYAKAKVALQWGTGVKLFAF
ncbi:MAG: TolC family protein [Bacteroidia bacterium]|jgi:outer membrane protein TolC|nr:TolC family protein [Bacteroidia bacterium]